VLGELTELEIEQVLHEEVLARIGCHAEGMTYVVPITYAYDGESIVGHSRDGMKLRMMRENPAVCVEVDHMDDLANWRSVIAWGRYEELIGVEAIKAMQKLVLRMTPLMASETAIPTHGVEPSHTTTERAALYRIRLTKKTGRFERR
jgi:nitroimidazol reductase NimA-like FMN-containing flavoprotein (pyridoxamine 5'-phosphate oxidase superfamily)